MKKLFVFLSLVFLPAQAVAADCWLATNFSGQSAQADRDYKFAPDKFDQMLICFTDEGGIVTGNDLQLVRFGMSTLIGFGANEQGLEVVNVYQIDREREKLLFTQSRIGTATVTPLLPDYAAVFIADVTPVTREHLELLNDLRHKD